VRRPFLPAAIDHAICPSDDALTGTHVLLPRKLEPAHAQPDRVRAIKAKNHFAARLSVIE